jgi:Ni/Co efflux regulator RcnB
MWRIAVLIIVTLTITIPVQAKQNKQKKHETSQYVVEKQVTVERRGAFSPAERNLIRAQLLGQTSMTSQRNHKKLPPGLQKKIARGKALPPGWQKKVTPGQNLDYHVYRQGESLPDILLRRLPPPPTGSEILRVEDKIIRLNAATRAILDVFDLTPIR